MKGGPWRPTGRTRRGGNAVSVAETHLKHLTPRQLAERWGFHIGTLANMRSEERGPAYLKLGGAVLYRVADVEAYEAAARVSCGDAA
jgi:hypothetical protein